MPATATPTASPSGGQVNPGSTFTLACATEGATIRYTYGTSPANTGWTTYSGAVTLPATSGQTVVFRERAAGAFESVPVRTGAVVGDRTVVSEGLAAGDRIVVAGAYALKARLLKEQLGEGHGH